MGGRAIRIVAGPVSATATLDDSGTGRAVWDALPIEASAETWGEEVYFGIPVSSAESGARAVVQRGDLAYWPPGRALCIFFGPTPASRGEEIRPASPVNVCGRLDGDPTEFRKVRAGMRVRLERADGPGGAPPAAAGRRQEER